MSSRPTLFEMPVDDPDRAEKFYANVFGWGFDSFPGHPTTTAWRRPVTQFPGSTALCSSDGRHASGRDE